MIYNNLIDECVKLCLTWICCFICGNGAVGNREKIPSGAITGNTDMPCGGSGSFCSGTRG